MIRGLIKMIDTGKRLFDWDAHAGHEIVCLRYVTAGNRSLLVTAAKNDDVVYWDTAKLAPARKTRKKRRRR